jgi:cytochrome oxidase assembly protein ShyY1
VSITRLALSRKWLGYLALTVTVAIVCVGFGLWQWARREEAVAEISLIEDNYDAEPVNYSVVMGGGQGFDPADEWLPVVLEGEYLAEDQLLARNRPRDGRPGFGVLTPLQFDDGTIVVIDRGWLPIGSAQDSPDVVPEAPSGRVEVTARLKPGEPTITGRGAPEGQIATINLPQIAELLGDEVETTAYGQLIAEDPAPAQRPLPAQRPILDEGPHLSYTFQWYVFAILAFIGFGWALRQDARAVESERTGVPVAEPARRRPSDADEEDALLDAGR